MFRTFRKNARSLPRTDYGDTGNRLFIGLVVGTSLLLCLLLLLSWLIPTLGFAGIHPLLPALAALLFGCALLFVLWMGSGLAFYAYTGHRVPGSGMLWRVTVRLLLPLMEMMARLCRIPVSAVRRSFIKVNNELVLGAGLRCSPDELLLLLPHCIQSSRCSHRLTYRVDNCARCGRCPMRALLDLRDKWGIKLAVAVGGTIARRIVVQEKPRVIVAVACERDLASGIQDTCPLPVFGVINERPHGPCLDTLVDPLRLETALKHFVRKAGLPQDGREDAANGGRSRKAAAGVPDGHSGGAAGERAVRA